jgi:23S rRNA pseudouridine1911/1915/1917 synthase
MRKIELCIPPEFEGAALKGFLRKHCGVSAGLLASLKREPGGITRNGYPVIATDLLHRGDRIILSLPEEPASAEAVTLPFSVVYEDEDLLVADKPPGMPMYPCPGHDRDSLANGVAEYCRKSGEPYAFRPVYRIDRDTTGLVVLAKNRYAAGKLAGKIQKTYSAVCMGALVGEGEIDEPIGLLEGHTIQRAVTPEGQTAVTRWKSVSSAVGATLLALTLETGRTHQIRVHLAHIGHPLFGDDLYGGTREFIGRQALHCSLACFPHPVYGDPLVLRSPFPEDMVRLMDFLGFPQNNFSDIL